MLCVVPHCHREIDSNALSCPYCGMTTLLNDRFQIRHPLRSLEPPQAIDVFEVLDTQTRQPKILKVLNLPTTKRLELLEREAAILSLIRHPGIPQVDLSSGYFSLSIPNSPHRLQCLVLEKIPGITLEEWLTKSQLLTQDQAIDWLTQLAEILHHLHGQGYFHRDIKPSNIMLKPDGKLALIDFGSVRELTGTYLAKVSRGSESNQIADVTIVTSANYTPLEQIHGRAVPQSDFYALGRTFIHLLTQTPLINLPEDPKTGRLVWRDQARQISPTLADLIDDLTALLAAQRPQNTKILLNLIQRIPQQERRRQFFRSPLFRVTMGALCTGAAFIGYQGFRQLSAYRHSEQGLAASLQGQLEVAKDHLTKATEMMPDNSDFHNNLAVVCQQLGTPAGQTCASQHYEKAIRLSRQPSQRLTAYYNLGNLYEEQGDLQNAEKYYKIVAKTNTKQSIDANNNLARLLILSNDIKSAEAIINQALQQQPDPVSRAALLKNQGWINLLKRNYPQARRQLQESLQLDPNRTDTYCLLAQVDERSQQIANANKNWESCLLGDSITPEVREWQLPKLRQLLQKTLASNP